MAAIPGTGSTGGNPVPRVWSSATDPVVGAGPLPGSHRTRSGRLVDGNGIYMNISAPASMDPKPGQVPGDPYSKMFAVPHPSTAYVPPHPLVTTALDSRTNNNDSRRTQGITPTKGGGGGTPITSGVNTAPYPYKPGKDSSYYTSVMNQILQKALGSLGSGASTIDPLSLMKNMIDPQAYAAAGANQQYDAGINTLQRELGHLQPQGDQNQKDISDWYGQLGNTNTANADEMRKSVAQNVAELQGSTTGLNNALGGDASAATPGISSASTLGEAGLRSMGQADSSFMTELGSIIGLQKNQALLNDRTTTANSKSDLSQQIADAQKEKGQAYTKLLGDAQQQDFSNRLQAGSEKFNEQNTLNQNKWTNLNSAQNMAMGTALAKGQMKSQDLANVGSQYDIGQKAQNLQTAPMQLQSNIDQVKANIDAANTKAAGGQSWNLQVPAQKAALQQALRSSGIVGANGGLAMNAQAAWNSILLGLDAAGLSSSKQALAIGKAVLGQALNKSHSQGQFKNFHVSNGQLVLNKKK